MCGCIAAATAGAVLDAAAAAVLAAASAAAHCSVQGKAAAAPAAAAAAAADVAAVSAACSACAACRAAAAAACAGAGTGASFCFGGCGEGPAAAAEQSSRTQKGVLQLRVCQARIAAEYVHAGSGVMAQHW